MLSWSRDQTILEERKRGNVERFSDLGVWLNESVDRKCLSVLGEIVFVSMYSTISLKTKLCSAVC